MRRTKAKCIVGILRRFTSTHHFGDDLHFTRGTRAEITPAARSNSQRQSTAHTVTHTA